MVIRGKRKILVGSPRPDEDFLLLLFEKFDCYQR